MLIHKKRNLTIVFGIALVYLLFNYLLDSNSKLIHLTYVHLLESNDEIILENLRFFFHFAYVPCSSIIDFTFILNTNDYSASSNEDFDSIDSGFDKDLNDFFEREVGLEILTKLKQCSTKTSKQRNTFIIKRLNQPGSGICAYNKLWKSKKFNENSYKYFFYINSSARGPFLPKYWTRPW